MRKMKGKKRPVKVQDPSLQSGPLNTANEFEGLSSFEEVSECTFLKLNKYGKVKREVWKDGKIVKKKNRKRKKGKKFSLDGKLDTNVENQKNIKEPSVKSLKKKSKETSGAMDATKNKSKKRKKKAKGETKPQTKKAKYDKATIVEGGAADKKNVDVSAWNSLFVPPQVLTALSELGFSTPTEIQKLVLPPAIHGRRDIVGAAETGSGKTLAFGIPIIHGILRDKEKEALANSTNDEDNNADMSDEVDANLEDDNLSVDNIDLDNEDRIDYEENNFLENDGDEENDVDEYNFHENDEDEENDVDGNNIHENDEDEESDVDENNSDNDENPFIFTNSDNEEDSDDEIKNEFEVCKKKSKKEFGCVKVINNVEFDFLDDGIAEVVSVPVLKKPLRALIVTPTRELAIQVNNHLAAVLVHTDIKTAVVIGGLASEKQARILKRGPDIVIGTPGRLWELIEQGNEHLCQIPNIKYLAIDETDRMVEKGHFEELLKLLEMINNDESGTGSRQNFIFSATLTMVHTLPKRVQMKRKTEQLSSEIKVKKLAKLIGLKAKPKVVDVTRKFGTAESLTESRINCPTEEKDLYLYYFIKQYPGRSLVFCNSIDCVRRLQKLFTLLQCHPVSLHASMHQKQRLKSLEKFSTSPQALLLATDVAARGLDIPNIQHVLHYQTPRTAESYVHRSGRTARASQEGLSVLFIDPTEMTKYRQLCTTLNRATDLPPFPVDVNIMSQVKARLGLARKLESLEHSHRKTKAQQNWFKKAAQEAELYIDDSDEDSEDHDEASEIAMQDAKARRDVNNMRMQLMQLLATPFISADFSGKYPTKSGALIMPIDNKSKAANGNHTNNVALSLMKKESVDYSNLIKTVKIKPPVDKKKKKKLKGFQKRKLKLQREKEMYMKEKQAKE